MVEGVEISVHVITGKHRPKMMNMEAWIKDKQVVVMVDNGSSHNFINPFKVSVASGKGVTCKVIYKEVPIRFRVSS